MLTLHPCPKTFHLVIAAGAVSHLGTLLTLDAFPGIQQEAAWALSLLASGETDLFI